MSFSKLDSGITRSSVWNEPLHVRVVWVSFLAEKDENGFVSGSRIGLPRLFNVSQDQFDDALRVLESPDPNSRTADYDGRRIAKVDGGWIVLNHEKYRLDENKKKEQHREYMRKWREKNSSVNNCEFTEFHTQSPSVSVSVSSSVSSFKEGVQGEPFHAAKFAEFRKAYPPNGSTVDPGAEKAFYRELANKIDPDRIIASATAYSEFWKAMDPEAYPHVAYIAQAVNWLEKRQYEVDWLARLQVEQKKPKKAKMGTSVWS